jgi:hypothetical protein
MSMGLLVSVSFAQIIGGLHKKGRGCRAPDPSRQRGYITPSCRIMFIVS